MSFLRPLIIVLLILGACVLSWKYSEHHTATNDDAFQALYMHVMPATLVTGGHADAGHDDVSEDGHGGAHPLIAIPLPGFMGFFDGDSNPENGAQLVMSNLQIFQILAVLLVFVAFSGVATYIRTGEGDVISRKLAGFCLWVRDDMVYPILGKEQGEKFLPYFLSLGFFILFMNVLGLVPGSATATASIFVTAALALITLFSMLGCGMFVQGPIAFWKNLVPHVPGWLWPLMFLVEVVGVMVKPFALLIRLFANMTGGHMVVLSFMGLIFAFAGTDFSAVKGFGIAPVSIAFAVFIMIIEAFVAMLQAYIFTLLSIIFVGQSMNPEH